MPGAVNMGDMGVPPQAGSGHSPKGGATSSTASPAKPSVPNAAFVPPPLADKLSIVRKLERGADALSVGDIWLAAGIIKALYTALSETTPEVAALAHCCHSLDQAEMWEVVRRADLALSAARQ